MQSCCETSRSFASFLYFTSPAGSEPDVDRQTTIPIGREDCHNAQVKKRAHFHTVVHVHTFTYAILSKALH
jgi:hypothetical protein